MKTNFFLATAIALSALFFSCGGDDPINPKCTKTVAISSVLPKSNPAGYEVLLKTSGFSDTIKVVFGSVEATWRPGGAAGEIIAKVPAGLSGNVEISVEEGDCIARLSGFTVLGGLPGNVQPSLPDIIVPVPLSNLPLGNINNQWTNLVSKPDTSYNIQFNCDLGAGDFIAQLDTTSKEVSKADFLNNNPVTGTVNRATNVVYMEINRTAKSNGTIEKFDGLFIEVPSFAPNNPQFAILFVSRETGRQLLILSP